MPGLTDWFDVFRCGTHTDRFGHTVTITRADIDGAIKDYSKNSAPIVVGHPTLNAPAFGWIEQFRRVGDTVQAKASTVADEFNDLVQRKLYKNRSLAFGPGLKLRHVGFLGAMPPAVKGLQDIQFSQEEGVMAIEMSENDAIENNGPESISISEAETQADTAQSNSDEAVTGGGASVATEATADSVDKNDLESVRQELVNARAEVEKHAATIRGLEAALGKERREKRRAEFSQYTEELVKSGRLPGGSKELCCEFMECLDGAGNYEFASGEAPVLERFKGLLNDILRPAVEFSEVIPFGSHSHNFTSSDYAQQIKDIRKTNPHVSASQAMAMINGGK